LHRQVYAEPYMNKIKLLFFLTALITLYHKASAQESIIPEISDAYVEKLIATAKANYPHVKVNQGHIKIAEGNIGKAKASYFDAFTFSYIYQPQGVNTLAGASGTSNYSYFNGIQVGIFFNLGTFLEKPYGIRAAKGDLEVANYEQDEYLLELANNVKKRYYTYIQTVANLKLSTQTCQDATSVLTDMKHKFQLGEETYDNYNKAQTNLTVAYQAKITAEANFLIAKSDLEELLGDKLENIK